MFSKWRIGSIAGIGVFVHWTFLLLLIALVAPDLLKGRTAIGLERLASILLLFGIVVLHEAGHALAARRFGIGTRDITLYPIGGVARLERMPRRPIEEMIVSLAGPAVNIALAGLSLAAKPYATSVVETWLVDNLLAINIALAIFNLLPAFPMDGGRVLRAILAMKKDFLSATRTAARVGRFMAVVFGLIGLFGIPGVSHGNPMLVLIAVFVWTAAGAEERAVAYEFSQRQSPFFWFVNTPRGDWWRMQKPGARETDYKVIDE